MDLSPKKLAHFGTGILPYVIQLLGKHVRRRRTEPSMFVRKFECLEPGMLVMEKGEKLAYEITLPNCGRRLDAVQMLGKTLIIATIHVS